VTAMAGLARPGLVLVRRRHAGIWFVIHPTIVPRSVVSRKGSR
jgi:hypothetical protein